MDVLTSVVKSVINASTSVSPTIEEPEILSLAEAAQHTTYSQEYLSLLARRGYIGAFKRGRNWYITRRDLERYIKSIEAKRRKNRLKRRAYLSYTSFENYRKTCTSNDTRKTISIE